MSGWEAKHIAPWTPLPTFVSPIYSGDGDEKHGALYICRRQWLQKPRTLDSWTRISLFSTDVTVGYLACNACEESTSLVDLDYRTAQKHCKAFESGFYQQHQQCAICTRSYRRYNRYANF